MKWDGKERRIEQIFPMTQCGKNIFYVKEYWLMSDGSTRMEWALSRRKKDKEEAIKDYEESKRITYQERLA